jgi:DHA3 family tetracycline resistance protein-like MFS transporter
LFADRFRLSAGGIYLLIAAWVGLAAALFGASYALYYITIAHLDALQLVLVGTALEASYFVFEIPTGVLADTFSRRLSVILGFGIIGVAWAGQGLVPTFVAIASFEVLRGLGEALVHGATEAWVAGEVGDDALDALFLREMQIRQVASFVGLPVGVGLALIDLRIPVVLGGALIAVMALALVFVMPERRHPRRALAHSWRATIGTARKALWSVRTSALLVTLLGAEFFWGAASEGYDRLWDPHLLLDLAFPPFGIPPVVGFGALSLAGTIVVVITAQVTRRHIKGVDERVVTKMLVALQVMRIAGRATFALAPVVGIALIGSFAERIVTASFSPLFNAWLIRRTNEDVRATVLSTTSMASALGQVGGGPVSGAIGNLMGIPTALLSSAALLVPATVFFARATARKTDEGKAPVPIEAPVAEKFG